jgi:hypothetical protein
MLPRKRKGERILLRVCILFKPPKKLSNPLFCWITSSNKAIHLLFFVLEFMIDEGFVFGWVSWISKSTNPFYFVRGKRNYNFQNTNTCIDALCIPHSAWCQTNLKISSNLQLSQTYISVSLKVTNEELLHIFAPFGLLHEIYLFEPEDTSPVSSAFSLCWWFL